MAASQLCFGAEGTGVSLPGDGKVKGSRTTVFKHCEDCHIEDDRIRKHKGTWFGWLNTKSMIG